MLKANVIFPKDDNEEWSCEDLDIEVPTIPPVGTILVITALDLGIPELGFQVTEARYRTQTGDLTIYVIPAYLTTHIIYNPYRSKQSKPAINTTVFLSDKNKLDTDTEPVNKIFHSVPPIGVDIEIKEWDGIYRIHQVIYGPDDNTMNLYVM